MPTSSTHTHSESFGVNVLMCMFDRFVDDNQINKRKMEKMEWSVQVAQSESKTRMTEIVGVKRVQPHSTAVWLIYELMIIMPKIFMCVDLGAYEHEFAEQNYDETEHTVEMPNEREKKQ